ncbi:hypothetical protein [Geminocystis herdmanii]|uniref:hypothetical protein n=1 Tax=Geminocystis herdmanii TaxID=669359 RepID=UPI00034BCE76|nr:hypothetical protein [Geminocystis herdmanii]
MSKRDLNPLFQTIDRGVKLAVKEAINKHRKLDEAISIYQDGKIITLKGDEIAKFLDDNS